MVHAYGRFLAALDPRSLVCFRILTGAVPLHDVGIAWESLDEWAGLQGYYDDLPQHVYAHYLLWRTSARIRCRRLPPTEREKAWGCP